MPRPDRQTRCRWRLGPGSFAVRARVERFVEPAVLLLLSETPSHGYDLADALEVLIGEGRVDFGNLYRLLRALEDEGLVASTWTDNAPGPLKRTYQITEEGIALLGAWLSSLQGTQQRIAMLIERYDTLIKAQAKSKTSTGRKETTKCEMNESNKGE